MSNVLTRLTYNKTINENGGEGSMLFRESETIELKEIVDEIKKEILGVSLDPRSVGVYK